MNEPQDAASATKATKVADVVFLQMADGKFIDSRWKDGNWDLSAFATTDKQGNPAVSFQLLYYDTASTAAGC